MKMYRYRPVDNSASTALETDVVRFVAVVGLTLMVVFALVHALPYRSEPESEEKIVEQATQEDLILIPKERLDALSGYEERLAATEGELATERSTHDDLQTEVRRANERAREMQSKASRTNQRAERLQYELASARRELAETRKEMARLESVVEPIEEPVAELVERVHPEAEPEAEPEPEPAFEPSLEVAEPPSAETIDDVFVLRFRDDQAYLDLLRRNRIESYLHVPGLDLTYEITGGDEGRLAFSLIYLTVPDRMYRIPNGMVPGVLEDTTRRFDVKLALRRDLEYLVVLSDPIRDQVHALESSGTTGYYDILPDETVVAGGGGQP